MVLLNGRLIVEVGDITRKPVDAVVNAANSSLLGGGGVDGAIHAVGGPEILAACREIRESEYPDGLPAGDAVITTGGRLPAGYVIHTVGPVWKDGHSGEEQLLTSAYLTSLSLAVDNEVETIAFPAISTGVYGYPREKAAPAVYEALKAWCAKYPLPEKIYLIFYKEQDRQIFLTYLNRPKTLAERS